MGLNGGVAPMGTLSNKFYFFVHIDYDLGAMWKFLLTDPSTHTHCGFLFNPFVRE